MSIIWNRTRPPHPRTIWRLWLAAGAWCVAVLSWFPFYFAPSAAVYRQGLAELAEFRFNWQSPLHGMVWFGLGMLLALAWGRMPWRHKLWRGAAVILAGSLLIELVQTAVVARHANSADVFIDVLAGWAGLSFVALRGRRMRLHRRALPVMRRVALLAALLLALTPAIATLLIHTRDHARNWDASYALLIGNEATGERPWRGQVMLVAIYPTVLPTDTIAQLAQTTRGDDAIELRRQLGAVMVKMFDGNEALPLGPFDGGAITEAVRRANALTVEVLCAPANLDQRGPARIVTLSQDTSHRNFTLGQHRRDVSFRVRTAVTGRNGLRHREPIFSDVFRSTQPHHLLAQWSNSRLTLYVDGRRHPRTIGLHTLRGGLGLVHDWGDYFLAIMLFVPLGILARTVCNRRGAMTLMIGAGVLPWGLAQGLCAAIYARPMEWGPLVFALVLGAVVIVAVDRAIRRAIDIRPCPC